MPLNAQGYFNFLKSYLNMAYYGLPQIGDEILLKEVIYKAGTKKKDEIIVNLKFCGDCFGVKLDKLNDRGNHEPLFHFLDNNGKPWSKRCDFILFHLHHNRIYTYCIEFKYETLPVESIMDQLNASVAWCRSLHDVIDNYANKRRQLNVTKYVFSRHPAPEPYLDHDKKYLQRDSSVRHYSYKGVNGVSLEQMENNCVEEIR